MENYFIPSRKKIAQLLLLESNKVIAKVSVDIESILKETHQVDLWKEYENLENEHSKFKNKLEQRRAKKWQKLKEKEKDSLSSNNQSLEEKYPINSTLENMMNG